MSQDEFDNSVLTISELQDEVDDGDEDEYEYEDGDEQKWEHLFREAVWHVKQFQDNFFPLTESSK